MALIGSIRQRQGLILGFLGISLLLFLVTSMTQDGGSSLFSNGQGVMGSVAGEDIDNNDLQEMISSRFSNATGGAAQQRAAAWEAIVKERLLNKEAEGLGITVSNEELKTYLTGRKSPMINQYLQMGVFDQKNLNSFIRGIDDNFQSTTDETQKAALKDLLEQVRYERLEQKLNKLGQGAAYVPTWHYTQSQRENKSTASFQYVMVPFDAEGDVEVTDGDIKDYIKAHAAEYTNEEATATVEYITFDVKPTAGDSAVIYNKIKEWTLAFPNAKNDTLYVQNREGKISEKYYKKSELNGIVNSANIQDSLFNKPVGSVIGPFVEGDVYKSVKLIDRSAVPDSVRARHILMEINQQNQGFIINLADSLKTGLEKGTEVFDSLVLKYSQDPGSKVKGGDLGYFAQGTMVQPFNDATFFEMDQGDYKIVYSRFGLHLIQLTGKKFITNEQGVRVATIERVIRPLDNTIDSVRSKVYDFIATTTTRDQLNTFIAENPDFEITSSPNLKPNDYSVLGLAPGDESRKIVKWAHHNDNEVGAVSQDVYTYKNPNRYYVNRFAIATLADKQEAGLASPSAMRKQLAGIVMNKKRGEMIADKIKGKSVTEIAAEYSTSIDTVAGVAFSSGQFNGVSENKVLASAFQINNGETSAPIVGNGGVYVIYLSEKNMNTDEADNLQNKKNAKGSVSINPGLMQQGLKKAYGVEDERYKLPNF